MAAHLHTREPPPSHLTSSLQFNYQETQSKVHSRCNQIHHHHPQPWIYQPAPPLLSNHRALSTSPINSIQFTSPIHHEPGSISTPNHRRESSLSTTKPAIKITKLLSPTP
jgi:hypothetical protein